MGFTTRRKFLFGSLGILGAVGITGWLEKKRHSQMVGTQNQE